MHCESPSTLRDLTTALLWSAAEHRGRSDLRDRLQLEDLHDALYSLRCRPEIERPEVIDLWLDLRELLTALMNGMLRMVPTWCNGATDVQADRVPGSVMWKSANDGDVSAESEPCICSFVALQWHVCTSEESRQPASMLEITHLVQDIRKAMDGEEMTAVQRMPGQPRRSHLDM